MKSVKVAGLVLGSMIFAGSAMASEPATMGWQFGCKLDAVAAKKAQSTQEAKIQEVKPSDENTWAFEDKAPIVVSAR